MTAEAHEVLGARRQPGVQVVRRDAPARPASRLAVERDQQRGPVMALHDPRRHDPDHSRVPALAGEHVCGLALVAGALGLRGEHDARLRVLALAVEEVELVGHLGRALVIIGEEQLEPGVGPLQAAGGVDPGREAEGERGGVHIAGVERGDLHQRPQSRPARARHGLEPLAHEAAVLAPERHEVGHRGQRDDVDVLGRCGRILAGGGVERLGQLVSDARGAEVGERVAADGWVHDRAGGQALARAVMIGDHYLQSEFPRTIHLRRRRDRAVHGDEQPGALGCEPLNGGGGEPVAVVEPARQVPGNASAQAPQRPHEHRGGGDAIHVVVAVHHNRRSARHVVEDPIARRAHVPKQERIVPLAALEEAPRALRRVISAPHENRRHRRREPKLPGDQICISERVGRSGPTRDIGEHPPILLLGADGKAL